MTTSSSPSAFTYLVDSSIYIFRAWYSVSDSIQDANGNPANATYGFCHFVQQLLSHNDVERVVFAFDGSLEESFRKDIYPDYKMNRDPAPEELKAQFQHCRDLIECLGYPMLSSTKYEADDLIGSMANKERQSNRQIAIVTGDKDLAQLVSTGDYWWNYAQKTKLYHEEIYEKLGVYPEQVADMLAIAGDAVDNIPGVRGIGATTATKLLDHFGDLDSIFANLEKVEELGIRGAKRIAALLDEYRETAYLSRRLTEIDCTVELPDYEKSPPDIEGLRSLLTDFGFSDGRIKQWLAFAESA